MQVVKKVLNRQGSHASLGTLNSPPIQCLQIIQSQKIANFATLSDERRPRSKIVLLFNPDKRTLRLKILRAHTFEKSWDFANCNKTFFINTIQLQRTQNYPGQSYFTWTQH